MESYGNIIKVLSRCNSFSVKKELQDLDILHNKVIDVASMKDVVCQSTKEVFHD